MDSLKVTVFMPVYNGEKYLKEAIESILNQTYRDFEFLIIDDGSTDSSADIVRSYSDSRIRFVQNETNIKIAATRNKGIELAKGEYIIPMDCDDISLPERIEKLVNFMEKNPEVGVCGAFYEEFGENVPSKIVKNPTNSDDIKAALFFFCAIPNVACIIRKKYLNKYNLRYDNQFRFLAEDLDLWFRCGLHFELANLPEILVKYRRNESSITHIYVDDKHFECHLPFYKRNLSLLGIQSDDEMIQTYHYIATGKHPINIDFLKLAEKWLLLLLENNLKHKVFPERAFSEILAQKWFYLCWMSTQLGLMPYFLYLKSPLSKYKNLSFNEVIKFPLKSIIKHDNGVNWKL